MDLFDNTHHNSSKFQYEATSLAFHFPVSVFHVCTTWCICPLTMNTLHSPKSMNVGINSCATHTSPLGVWESRYSHVRLWVSPSMMTWCPQSLPDRFNTASIGIRECLDWVRFTVVGLIVLLSAAIIERSIITLCFIPAYLTWCDGGQKRNGGRMFSILYSYDSNS